MTKYSELTNMQLVNVCVPLKIKGVETKCLALVVGRHGRDQYIVQWLKDKPISETFVDKEFYKWNTLVVHRGFIKPIEHTIEEGQCYGVYTIEKN